ncbi:penicillin acylase family protein [Methylocystis echinoides]|uniref:penicillin acylase family protein n=1 Tax=Methylocystis echinoides TaxID=29468 RepID=UPI002493C5E1|nr:penicillin acylase family protein [Methylocystis echinoides]
MTACLGAVGLLRLSLPQLEGTVTAAGLSAPVTVARDVKGAATLTGRTRADLAWGLGYIHAQERFFQMDLLRRSAAGELSDLVGRAALERDRTARLHRFRHRAAGVIAAMSSEAREVLDAYVKGVNRGLSDLRAAPFEYFALFAKPTPWAPEDTILTVFAMYLTLQESDGLTERRRAGALEALGQPLTDFLFPEGTAWDAALDGSILPTPKTPAAGVKHASNSGPSAQGWVEPTLPGSNAFGVGGAASARGAAIIANDMHMGLRVPNTWFRARLVLQGEEGPALDIAGVTLPGAPNIVAGSNGRVAWGFTNSYVDTSDVVILEQADEKGGRYLTPDGPKELARVEEPLCDACKPNESLVVEESVWGPVIGKDQKGRKLAYRWIAHDPAAVNLQSALELERAKSTRDALGIAHRMGIPHQNMVAGDVEGNLGWTVTSPLPRRFGHDGRTPASWADGQKGWNGHLAADEVPIIYNPAGQRIWTANARVVGGDALGKLGGGLYAHGARERQIRDALFSRPRLSETDLFAIQLDDRGLVLQRWRELLLQTLQNHAREPEYARLIPAIENWMGRAAPESIGYRLVRDFRVELISSIYESYMAKVPSLEAPSSQPRRLPTNQADEPAWRLLSERPAALVPPGYQNWNAVIDAALAKTSTALETQAGGRLEAFTWGRANHAGINHPLDAAAPGIGAVLLDPPDEPQPGDVYQPRVSAPGFGASMRFVVAPGHESEGIYHMPTGQSGHPLSPYYNLGHDDWAKGRATPFLPGGSIWRLTLVPSK